MGRLAKYLSQAGVILLSTMVLTVTSSNGQRQTQQQMARFKLADSYLRTGQYERAIPLLEDLYASDSTSIVYYQKLKDAYAGFKRYDKAISLVDHRLQMSRTPSLMAQKAALLEQKGQPEEALKTWQSAVELRPDHSGSYRAVYLSMIESRRFDGAIEILQEGRERLDRPDAFAIDLAYLYGLTSRHRRAAEEYLSILSEQPERLPIVKRRLSRYSSQEGALETTLRAVEQRVEEDPLHRPYRELAGWLYLQVGNYKSAFNEYRAIDRLETENGAVLYSFARKAADAGAYETAGKAYELILERYPDAPSAPDAQLGLAEMHRKQAEEQRERAYDFAGNRQDAPHYSAALEAYRAFVQNYPDHSAHATTLRKIGLLQLNVFRNPGRAESIFTRVVEQYPGTDAAYRAQLALGRVAILRDNLDEAQLVFSRLEDTLDTGEIAEMARYELALLHFYRGHFISATSLARALTRNTSTDIANDALELKLILTENKGPDSLNAPLTVYARARLYHRQQRYESATQAVDSLLTNYPSHPLNDEGFFLDAQILRERGRIAEAAETFIRLATRFPRSPLADKSLFQAARLYEQAMHDRQTALETYNKLLRDYPSSLLLPDARDRIRALRSEA